MTSMMRPGRGDITTILVDSAHGVVWCRRHVSTVRPRVPADVKAWGTDLAVPLEPGLRKEIAAEAGRGLTATDAGTHAAVLEYNFADYYDLPAHGEVTVAEHGGLVRPRSAGSPHVGCGVRSAEWGVRNERQSP